MTSEIIRVNNILGKCLCECLHFVRIVLKCTVKSIPQTSRNTATACWLISPTPVNITSHDHSLTATRTGQSSYWEWGNVGHWSTWLDAGLAVHKDERGGGRWIKMEAAVRQRAVKRRRSDADWQLAAQWLSASWQPISTHTVVSFQLN